ncbi:3-phosphoshikimate 1-carboxyvinyltransferase [Candidatus Cyanaurora vandensis]|uniref:3-phosphoshikimate 1-carboxyvinyltransferase n=1 Tax=Candidatus Cyanaurora vandensis TaxID=2714958 RepID=UPI0025801339|nr:3-phosphoshikimate 1-carboxyvinyltransferase [Candidatus Cyanaurora vandensis]
MTSSLVITGCDRLRGTVQVPGDKSISHRALMFGALAQGTTRIQGLLAGEDPQSTARCLRALGVEITDLTAPEVLVTGVGLGGLQEPLGVLDSGNSGTTLRLLLGVTAAQPGLFTTWTGDSSLTRRPMGRVVQPLTQMGAKIWGRAAGKFAPLAVQGTALQPLHYVSPVASAQVKSALLLAGLLSEGETLVTEPHPSRDHTERMLRAFGCPVTVKGTTVSVMGPAALTAQNIIVPGDISSAVFWLVAATITPDSELTLLNVGLNPSRTGALEVLQQMGADITILNCREAGGEPVADLRVRSAQLTGAVLEGALIPRLVDEIPVLAVAATQATGTTTIRDAQELRVKESDRLQAVAQQLGILGADITEYPDGLVIRGKTELRGGAVRSLGDHRMAMALAVAGLVGRGAVEIEDAQCAQVSYPNFFKVLKELRNGQ